jgi:hypothetical protein
LVETAVPVGPYFVTTFEPREYVNANELIFDLSAWYCTLPKSVPGNTAVIHVLHPIYCQESNDDDMKDMDDDMLSLHERDDVWRDDYRSID